MNVTVILIAYHGDRWLPACIASLALASAERLHLVLVDNSGNTCLDELDLSRFDAEILATPLPLGFAEANNYALVHASHLEEVVLFLNQDTISPAGWVDPCLDILIDDDGLGAVSPLIRTYDDDDWDPSFVTCLSMGQRQRLMAVLDGGEHVWESDLAPAPALLVRTDVLKIVGPFDPIYGSYYEDYDLCRRIRRAGYRIGFVRGASLQHYSGSTTDTPEKERRRMRRIVRNRLIYQIRDDRQPRWATLTRFFLRDIPYRMLRGLVRTPSSQPPAIVLQAALEVARLAYRLCSVARDEAVWKDYLNRINWRGSRH